MRLIAAVVSAFIVAVLASCGESTGPEETFSVSVTFEAEIPATVFEVDSVQLIQCDVRMRAVARGRGSAAWGDGKFYVFVGPNRATPTDSGVIPAPDVQQSWGASSIQSPDTQYSQWRVTAPIPFGVAFVYSYVNNKDGETKQTSPVAYTCGPTIPAGTAPPAFTTPQASPATGEIESGDTLTISYRVSSPIGIWATGVDVTGACNLTQRSTEHLAVTLTHALKLVIPPGCVLGGTLTAVISAMDAAGQITTASVASLSVVDRTAPTVSVTVYTNLSSLGEFVIGGDSLHMLLGATDNHALSGVFWEIKPVGRRDSLLQGSASLGSRGATILPDSSAQKIQVRVWSRDAVGLVSDTVATPTDSIRVIPTRQRSIRTSAALPRVGSMTIADGRGMVYATIDSPPEIVGISLQSLTVSDTIPLPAAAGDIDVTTTGDSLVVTLPDRRSVGVIDLRSMPRAIAELPLQSLGASNWPVYLRVATGGRVFITTGGNASTRMLLELNLQTGSDRIRTDAGANGYVGPAYLERSLDHAVLAIDGEFDSRNRLQRYDAASDAFGTTQPQDTPIRPSLDGTGAHIAMSNRVYDAALNEVCDCETPQHGVNPNALSFDGSVLRAAVGALGVLVNRVANGELLERDRLPFVASDVRISADGTMLILYDNQSSRIAVMELP